MPEVNPAVLATLCVLAVAGALALAVAFVLAAMVVIIRPWDGSVDRNHAFVQRIPYWAFWLGSYIIGAATSVAALKPPPERVAEIATYYMQSHVLFALVKLGVPDALATGPKTAAQLARALGPSVQPHWLDRLLSAAASMGMLKRARCRPADGAADKAPSTGAAASDAGGRGNGASKPAGTAAAKGGSAAASNGGSSGSSSSRDAYAYALNGVSAALTAGSAVSMASFVKTYEFHQDGFSQLAEGIRTSRVPFLIASKGRSFWDVMLADPARCAAFDTCMVTINHLGGSAVVYGFGWGAYDALVDVGGGVGGFLAEVMAHVPAVRQGVVFDLPGPIKTASKLWPEEHPELAPRVQLLAGDFFDAATLPAPPGERTGYVLRNILHDWPDKECVAILRALHTRITRARVDGEAGPGLVRLLIVEVTTAEEVMPCLLPYRYASDLTMLCFFGEGQERSLRHFRALLAEGGWRLLGMHPASSIYVVLEAEML